ncbi:AI-2E family transporter [Sulfurimonas sp. MAG313]|nr:AI-2E family transporter [Sulfurimonas sp. MAG313]MDF1881368.1 AI-2E family transporter [Sulfurimonas sp. MAG313]
MNEALNRQNIVSIAIEIAIKLSILAVILVYTFDIIRPFFIPVVWAIIIAVSLSPLINSLEKRFIGKRKLILTVLSLSVILSLLVPTYYLSASAVESGQDLLSQFKEGSLTVPPAPISVKEWPLVGTKLYTLWDSLATNLESFVQLHQDKLKDFATKGFGIIGSGVGTIFQFIISMIIAAVLLAKSEGSVKIYHAISKRLIGEKGVEWAELSALTVRSVVQGVLGIALIQATLSLIGLLLIGMPFAPAIAFVVLFLAIIQLPPILILGPVAAYIFTITNTTPAVIFAVYAFAVSMSDAFLKPILLGRGVDIPMLVILIGAIGGMIASGIIGLFVGAVVLALAYKLFSTWIEEELHDELIKD